MPPVLVIDFGSQVTQLIVRRVRESGVYCEVVPFNKAEAALEREPPRAIILSGGPASVGDGSFSSSDCRSSPGPFDWGHDHSTLDPRRRRRAPVCLVRPGESAA